MSLSSKPFICRISREAVSDIAFAMQNPAEAVLLAEAGKASMCGGLSANISAEAIAGVRGGGRSRKRTSLHGEVVKTLRKAGRREFAVLFQVMATWRALHKRSSLMAGDYPVASFAN
jgi:hypothetical protein